MRHTIESGGFAQSQIAGACVPSHMGFACGLALAGIVAMTAVMAHSESLARSPARQGSSVSGSHASSARGVPSHAPGYLGVLFQNLSDEQVSALHLKAGRGVEIVMVDHDGPAGKAGLRPHDVIVSLNGQMITGAEGLRRMIHDAGVGSGVVLTVVRGGEQVVVNVQLAYRGEVEREAVARMVASDPPEGADDAAVGDGMGADPVGPGTPGVSSRSKSFLMQMLHSTPFTGLMLEGMEPQLAGFFGAPAGVGLLVDTVTPNSPAAASGLRAGDVILKADSIEVKTTGEWVRRLQASRGRGIALVVLRDKQELRIMLIPELKRHSWVVWPLDFDALPTLA